MAALAASAAWAASAAMAAMAAVVQNVKMKEKIKLTYNWILNFVAPRLFHPVTENRMRPFISRLKYFVPQTVLINKKKLE